MTTLTLEKIITESFETMRIASLILEEHATLLAGDDSDGDRTETLQSIVYRLSTNAARLEGILIGMTVRSQ